MDGLKDWVRGLVLLVLLGSCLELLLPMNSMKKYVRMALGLLIVLSTTRPIIGLLGQPVTVDAELFAAPPDKHLPTLREILDQAAQFRAKSRALAATEAQEGLATEAVRAAKAVPGVADARATVELGDSAGEVVVQRLTVTVVPGSAAGVRSVQPVAPVRPAPPTGQTGGLPPPETPPGQRQLTEAEQKLAEAVRREVAARLGLKVDASVVRVLVESGPSSSGGRR
jgi:stage III sporulation protein AF